MRLYILACFAYQVSAHIAMWHPAPDFGITPEVQAGMGAARAPEKNEDGLYGSERKSLLYNPPQAFWYNTGTQIGCKLRDLKGMGPDKCGSMFPADVTDKTCCGVTMEPTIPKEYLTLRSMNENEAYMQEHVHNFGSLFQGKAKTWETAALKAYLQQKRHNPKNGFMGFNYSTIEKMFPDGNKDEFNYLDLAASFDHTGDGYAGESDRNPWNAPGYAPLLDACGIYGGYQFKNTSAWPNVLTAEDPDGYFGPNTITGAQMILMGMFFSY